MVDDDYERCARDDGYFFCHRSLRLLTQEDGYSLRCPILARTVTIHSHVPSREDILLAGNFDDPA